MTSLLERLPPGSLYLAAMEQVDASQARWNKQLRGWQTEAENRCENRICRTPPPRAARRGRGGGGPGDGWTGSAVRTRIGRHCATTHPSPSKPLARLQVNGDAPKLSWCVGWRNDWQPLMVVEGRVRNFPCQWDNGHQPVGSSRH